jgi:hypothetical protein
VDQPDIEFIVRVTARISALAFAAALLLVSSSVDSGKSATIEKRIAAGYVLSMIAVVSAYFVRAHVAIAAAEHSRQTTSSVS